MHMFHLVSTVIFRIALNLSKRVYLDPERHIFMVQQVTRHVSWALLVNASEGHKIKVFGTSTCACQLKRATVSRTCAV